MDMNKGSGTAEVPTFRVARVGQDRKRRGGGLPWLRGAGSGTRGVWGAGGATAAGVNVLGMSLSKTMLAVLVTCGIGSASIYAGQRSAANSSAASVEKPKLFAQDRKAVKPEGDISNLPSTSNSIPNSMGYVSGSIDGLTPEERARKAAAAAAAAEAQRKADEEAQKAEELAAKNGASGQPADPAALLAAAQADGKGGGLGKKFGQLSTGTGGGAALAGGAGLSGGVGRSFASAAFSKPDAGVLTAMRSGGAKPSFNKAGRAAVASSKTNGFARRQLANASTLSRQAAAAGKSEAASYDAASAFDNNQGAGTTIGGAGMGSGTNPSVGATPNPSGGPIAGPSAVDCGSGAAPNASGGCSPITMPSSKKAASYQSLIDIAQALMATLAVLAALALIANSLSFFAGAGEMIKKAITMAMMAIGAILIGLGLAIIAMSGDKIAGGIVTAVGALTLAMAAFPETLGTTTLVTQAAGGLIANLIGMMGVAATRKPAAASLD